MASKKTATKPTTTMAETPGGRKWTISAGGAVTATVFRSSSMMSARASFRDALRRPYRCIKILEHKLAIALEEKSMSLGEEWVIYADADGVTIETMTVGVEADRAAMLMVELIQKGL